MISERNMLPPAFLAYIRKENLFTYDQKLLLAISGGLDSVVLAHLLYENNFQFSFAHMNFQLRGADSDQDEAFVMELAEKYQCEIFHKKVKLEGEGKGSTQMQARKLRYDWFKEIMEANSFDKLLTAHHANDQLETALLNLVRGTGIKGMRGMLPKQNRIVRPLLFATKEALKSYATSENLSWREDVSNASDHYKRNRIRHHVMPKLEKDNPNLISGFGQTAERLRAAEYAYNEHFQKIKKRYVQQIEGGIRISREFLLYDKFALVYMADLLSEYGFSLPQLQAFKFKRNGAQLASDSHILTVDRGWILVLPPMELDAEQFPIKVAGLAGRLQQDNFELRWELVNPERIVFHRSHKFAYFDADQLELPFFLDIWKQGDKMQPLGMKSKKKISDILIDEKVPLPVKASVMVLKNEHELLWLIGHRQSEIGKITAKTKKVLRFEYSERVKSI